MFQQKRDNGIRVSQAMMVVVEAFEVLDKGRGNKKGWQPNDRERHRCLGLGMRSNQCT